MPVVEIQYSPSSAVALLDQLQRVGFNDSSFKIIHHLGPEATIQAYYNYCKEKVATFQNGGANERVCKRLAIIQKAFKACPFSIPANPAYVRPSL